MMYSICDVPQEKGATSKIPLLFVGICWKSREFCGNRSGKLREFCRKKRESCHNDCGISREIAGKSGKVVIMIAGFPGKLQGNPGKLWETGNCEKCGKLREMREIAGNRGI